MEWNEFLDVFCIITMEINVVFTAGFHFKTILQNVFENILYGRISPITKTCKVARQSLTITDKSKMFFKNYPFAIFDMLHSYPFNNFLFQPM